MKWLDPVITYRPGAIARSSLNTTGIFALRLFVQLSLLFVIARFLGPDGFGEYIGIAALGVVIGSLSSVGTGYLVLGASSKSEKVGVSLILQAIPLTLVAALFLLPVYILVAWHLIGSSAGITALMLIGLTELLFMPMLTIYVQHIQGLGKVARSQLLLLVPLLGRLALLAPLLAILPSGSLGLYSVLHCIPSVAALAFCMFSLRLSQWKSIVYSRPDPGLLLKGVPYAFMRFTSLGPGEVDKMLALRMLGPVDTGLFGFAARGVAVSALPVTAMVLASQPRIFQSVANGTPQTRRLIWAVFVAAVIYGVFAFFVFRTVLPRSVEWLLGQAYVGITEVLAAFSIVVPLICIRLALGGMAIPLGLPGLRSGVEWIGIATLATGAFLWVPDLGVHGLIRAIIASEAVMSFLLIAAFAALNTRSFQRP